MSNSLDPDQVQCCCRRFGVYFFPQNERVQAHRFNINSKATLIFLIYIFELPQLQTLKMNGEQERKTRHYINYECKNPLMSVKVVV